MYMFFETILLSHHLINSHLHIYPQLAWLYHSKIIFNNDSLLIFSNSKRIYKYHQYEILQKNSILDGNVIFSINCKYHFWKIETYQNSV